MNPALIHDIAGHGLAHVLYSHVRKSSRKKGLSRRMARKMANRKRRWFVDNIIMHHKRLHDRNREMVVSNARTRALMKKKNKDTPVGRTINKTPVVYQKTPDAKWQQRVVIKDRSNEIRERLEARRMRANSRWASIIRNNREASASNSSE